MSLLKIDVDALANVCVAEDVARKRTKHVDKELDEMLGEIRKRWKGTDAELAKEGGVAPSTWHAWRAGDQGPRFLQLREVARVAGCDVRLVINAASGADGEAISTEAPLKPETAEVARLMNRLPEDARAAIRDAVHEKVAELVGNPQEPGAEAGSSHARHK